jgi:phage-related protein
MVKLDKGFGNWIPTVEAAKLSGFTKATIWLKIQMGEIKKVRRIGNVYLLSKKEVMALKRRGRGAASLYEKKEKVE